MKPLLERWVAKDAQLTSDSGATYKELGRLLLSHDTVNHSEREYARGEVHSNTAESYAADLERILIGVFHWMSKPHMSRYLAEASFRWNAKCELENEEGDHIGEYVRRPPLHQITMLFRHAVGCELRRSNTGGVRRPHEADAEPRRRIKMLERRVRDGDEAALVELLSGIEALESPSSIQAVHGRPRRRRRRIRGWTRERALRMQLTCRSFAANAVRLQLRALAYNLGNFMVSHGRYVIFQMTEVAVPRQMLTDILSLVARLRAPPAPA